MSNIIFIKLKIYYNIGTVFFIIPVTKTVSGEYTEIKGKGGAKMCGKRKALGIIILSFSLGALISAVLPLWILAIIETVILILIGWCFFSER